MTTQEGTNEGYFNNLSFITFLSFESYADDKAAVAVRASTLGIGGELAINVNENVNVRIGLYGLKLGRD